MLLAFQSKDAKDKHENGLVGLKCVKSLGKRYMLTTDCFWQYDTVAHFSLTRVTVELKYFRKFDPRF